MNMNKILDWIKKNVVIVVLVVVMIAALVVLPMYAAKQGAAVREEVQSRFQKVSELEKLDKTSFEDPVTGEVHQVAVNEALLRRYEQVIETKRRDGEQVLARALSFNRDGHELIIPSTWSQSMGPWLFPAPPDMERQVRPRQFHELLVNRYQQLLNDIGAGSPPDAVALAAELQEKEGQFRLHTLSKTAEETLDPEDQRKLTEHLQAFRLQRYEEVAASIGLYADIAALNVPGWNQANQPSLAELFQWQWQYWMIADVLTALANANADDMSVLQAPVKRLLNIAPTGAPSASIAGGDSSAGGTGGGMMSGGSGMASGGQQRGRRPVPGGGMSSPGAGAMGAAGGANTGGPQPLPINASQPVPIDYSVSFTGRQSNHLYDVRYVQLSIIADTERLPRIIDALAAQNFITVLDMSMQPVDPYEHIRQGYMYGDGTICRADMVLETVWLRQWTSEHMPDELKSMLGIPVQQPAPQPGAMP